MKLYQKIAGAAGLAFIGIFEIAERADFIKGHLPRWVTIHSDLTVVALLIALCMYLIFTHADKEQPGVSASLPPVCNTSAGGASTATAQGGKIEQHIYFRDGITYPQPPSQGGPKHNVQCLGLIGITEPPQMLALCFENVLIPNEPVGEFKSARLKVVYYNNPGGEEILEVFPARWWGTKEATVNLGTKKMYAEIASYFEGGWKAHQVVEMKTGPNTLLIRFLPLGEKRIVATLIGEGNLSIAPITGILTLEKGGSASFEQTTD